eukprot:TRINITY_DN11564_c0_g1_i1.p1 TRINITY_DN11564_c0_g1~~TRINITY_DN11564_c0_g1_i1.p1  ORF type:complete len:469 (-),score=61.38 TRINITY_DN11564_c0_g1_i1:148-1554(-)
MPVFDTQQCSAGGIPPVGSTRLYKGRHTEVWVGVCPTTNEKLAYKVFDKKSLPAAARIHIEEEIAINQKLALGYSATANQPLPVSGFPSFPPAPVHSHVVSTRRPSVVTPFHHPNIVRFIEATENTKCFALSFEYVSGGTLHSLLRRQPEGKLPEKDCKLLFSQLMCALNYAHTVCRIAHRDIKLENVFVDGKGNVKLGDWGLAVELKRKISSRTNSADCSPCLSPGTSPVVSPLNSSSNWMNSSGFELFSATISHDPTIFELEEDEDLVEGVGTRLYLAPEILKGKPYKGPEIDVWSAGVLLYQMLHGNFPFHSTSAILEDPLFVSDEMSSDAAELLAAMLEKESENRISVADILQHPWLESIPKDPLMSGTPTSTRKKRLVDFVQHLSASSSNSSLPSICLSPATSSNLDDSFNDFPPIAMASPKIGMFTRARANSVQSPVIVGSPSRSFEPANLTSILEEEEGEC